MKPKTPTTAHQVARYAGLDDLHELEYYSGIKVRTLQNWFHDNRKAFDCMLAGAMVARINTL